MRITRAFFVPLLTAATACSGSAESLTYSALITADVDALTAKYQARFFDDRRCEDLITIAGRPDAARTATAAITEEATEPDGFEPVDLRSFSGTLALEVRASAADGIPLARRCVPVDSAVESTVLELASFAPAGAIVTLVDDTALLAGTVSKPIEIKVTDAQLRAVQNVLISSGPTRALVATDAMGIARVRTPTDTPSFEGPLELEIYGVPGRKRAFASALDTPDCPTALFTRQLVTGVRGAPAELAASGGYAFVSRQRSSTASTGLLEVLAIESQTAGLRTVVTATTTGIGAIAATPSGGEFLIAVAANDRAVELFLFDPAAPSIRSRGRLNVEARSGAQPLIRRLIFLNEALIVAGEGLEGGGSIFRSARPPALPAFDADRDFLDLTAAVFGDETEDSLLGSGSEGVELFTFDGGTSAAPRASIADLSVRFASGRPIFDRLVPYVRGDRLGVLSVDLGEINRYLEAAGPEALEAAAISPELNDDTHHDVLAGGRSGVHLFIGDGRGRFLAAASCALESGVSSLQAIAGERWLAYLRQSGEIAVLGYEP